MEKFKLVRPNILLAIYLFAIAYGFAQSIIQYVFFENLNKIQFEYKIVIFGIGSFYLLWFFVFYLRKLFNWSMNLQLENENLIIKYKLKKLKKLKISFTEIESIEINENKIYSNINNEILKQFEFEVQKPMLGLLGKKQGLKLTIKTKKVVHNFDNIESENYSFLKEYFEKINYSNFSNSLN